MSTAGTLGANTGALQVNNTNTGGATAVELTLATSANTTVGSLSGAITTAGHTANITTGSTGGARLFTVNQTAAGTYAGTISGSGNFALGSLSTNTLTLTGDNSYSGTTTINKGTLEIAGSGDINQSSSITIGSGATFRYNSSVALTKAITNNGGSVSGSGNLGTVVLGGIGTIDPGNSPGILTAGSTDPTGGLDYNFEFTAASAPTWNAPTASLNDVLRLTGGSPFVGTMDADNLINVYFGTALSDGQVFTGGFFTDNTASFLTSISGAGFNYYTADAGGDVTYNGAKYFLYSGPLDFTVATVAHTADFGAGSVDGYVTQFTVAIPEPGAALLGGIGMLLLLRRRRC